MASADKNYGTTTNGVTFCTHNSNSL